MPDQIGRINVPDLPDSGATFPLSDQGKSSDYGYGMSQDRPVVVHRFQELDCLAEQRFKVGIGPRKFHFKRAHLTVKERRALVDFWEARMGPWESFFYQVPDPAQGWQQWENVKVRFENAPLNLNYFLTTVQGFGITLVEVPDNAKAPVYDVTETCLRFPSRGGQGEKTDLAQALTSQVQEIVPLVHIEPRELDQANTSLPNNIYLSDRRCYVKDPNATKLYIPRLLGIGEAGSDVLITQSINGGADTTTFSFGNADRVMTKLANDTDLKNARIELCLYHVQSKVLLQLWAGYIVSFKTDGTSVFSVQASDGLYQMGQMYPPRTVSRMCWKPFDSAEHDCPYSSAGSGGDPKSCDHFWDSPNGCRAHGMDIYFGGHPAQPQGVLIKDNSTGTWGFGRNVVTATSIVSDTVWGNALPQIYCNDHDDPLKAFIAPCMIIAGRDESEFYTALGIVGEGPIGKFSTMKLAHTADGLPVTVAPLLDGQTPHGWSVDTLESAVLAGLRNAGQYRSDQMGLVEVPGVEGQTNPFCMTQTTGDLGPQKASGTAWCEIRRVDEKGIQPSLPNSHSMTVPISQGLDSGQTNPFRVAALCYLRSLGIRNANPNYQQQFYDDAAMNTCADIADLPPLVPLLNEDPAGPQFEFQGTLAQQKPFRDWLSEILSCTLGYYVFRFGKLTFGVRVNASAVSAFTIGNMILQSLELSPIEASFEKLIIEFGDQAYQYQTNQAEYSDLSHAEYYGRTASPLTQRARSVGLCKLAQGLRIAATRVREEIGGVTTDEWRNARIARWKTTVLALETEAGQVVSITHPDVPGGFGHFRIQKWSLLRDWSIAIEAKSVTASMYDLDAGPKPADVNPDPLPGLFYPLPLHPAWEPYQIQANDKDALFPNEWNFNCDEEYPALANGAEAATLIATGKLPTNEFISGAGAPKIGKIDRPATGGQLLGGTTYRVSIVGKDADGLATAPSNIAIVQIAPGTNTNQIVLSNIQWPVNVQGLVSHDVFMSDKDYWICSQQTGSGTPDTITINGPLIEPTYAMPNPYVQKLRIKAKIIRHSGVLGARVSDIVGDTQIEVSDMMGESVFNPVGRILSVIGRPVGSSAFASWTITSWDPVTAIMGLDRSVNVNDQPELSILKEDAITIRCRANNPNKADPRTITDSGYRNILNAVPYDGMVVDGEVGNLIRVIAGKGRGMPPRKIVANDQTSLTWDLPLEMDETSVWIIEEPTWRYSADSTIIRNADPLKSTEFRVPLQDWVQKPVLFEGVTIDLNGNESPDGEAPIREDWIFGNPRGLREKDRATFGIGIGGVQPIGNDLTNHFMCRQPDGGGIYIECIGNCKTPMPSATLPLRIDIERAPLNTDGVTHGAWLSIFPDPTTLVPDPMLILPPNDREQHAVSVFRPGNDSINPGDWLRINLLAGSNEGSSDIEVVVRWGA